MEQFTVPKPLLLQLCKLAGSNGQREARLVLNQLSSILQKQDVAFASEIAKLGGANILPRGAVRKQDIIPVDQETRMHLLRIVESVVLPHEPVWDATVEDGLNYILDERRQLPALVAAGMTPSKAALFTGPPGVGKTFAAYWLARELNKPLRILDLATVISSYLGRTGVNIRYVMDYAKNEDCVLLIDELDSLGKRRDDDQDVGELKRLVTVLLQELDDWPGENLLIAATNHPELLDRALWRRFDPIIEFGYPKESTVKTWIKQYWSENSPWPKSDAELSSSVIAIAMKGSSYNDIEHQIQRIFKQSVLKNISEYDALALLVKQHLALIPDKEKRQIAYILEKPIGQRKASELTGVARNTIREHRRNNAKA